MKLKYLSGAFLTAATFVVATACDDETVYEPATGNVVASITTGEARFNAVSAELNGNVQGLGSLSPSSYEVGFYYGTADDPVGKGAKTKGIFDTETQTISSTLTGLTPGTTYYYCAYVLLQGRVFGYGDVKTFVATDANIATAGILDVTSTTATVQGQFRGTEGVEYQSIGFLMATNADDVMNGIVYEAEAESIGNYQYTVLVDNLLPSSTYFLMAFLDLDGKSKEYGEVTEIRTADQSMEYIDMGLSVCWSAYNLGAEDPAGQGTRMDYEQALGVLDNIQIDADGNYISALPTRAEVQELLDNCDIVETEMSGVKGYNFVSKKNGNTLFVPSGSYWTNEVKDSNSSYAYTLNDRRLGSIGLTQAIGVRTCALEVVREGIRIYRSRIKQGDIEGNGNYRVELYNAYGATANAPAVNPDDIRFETNMRVTFTIEGINDGQSHTAYISYASGDWSLKNFEYHEDGEASVAVPADGTYSMILHGASTSTNVFCIDFPGLSADCGAENINVRVETVEMDVIEEKGVLRVDQEKLLVGDIEKNGNIRIELYNEYGASKADPSVDPTTVVFSENVLVTFTIKGITGNLNEGAAETHVAGLQFAAKGWNASYWSKLEMGKYEAPITKDGTYSVWYEVSNKTVNGAIVFCVDIKGLAADLVDPGLVTVEDVAVRVDHDLTQPINTDLNTFQNLDGKGIDARIELYNQYGLGGKNAPGFYDDMKFHGMCIAEYTIEGITGNLKEGAAGTYTSTMSFADKSWSPSYWGGNSWGNADVTGDGTYQVFTYLNGDCEGVMVWTIEIYGLWQDLVDPSQVKVTVNRLLTPQKL